MGDEAQARDEICAVGLSIFPRGLTFGSTGNISVRLPDGGWLMTPTNASLGTLDPRGLVEVRHRRPLDSAASRPRKRSCISACTASARRGAVVHLHSTHSVAVSLLADVDPRDVLPPLTAYYVMRVGRSRWSPIFRRATRRWPRRSRSSPAAITPCCSPITAPSSRAPRSTSAIRDRGARGDRQAVPDAARRAIRPLTPAASERPARTLQSPLTGSLVFPRANVTGLD